MSDQETLTVTQVAKRIGKSAPTVRRYSADYADHLDDGANPPEGETRQYTAADLQVLATVAALMDQRQTADQVRAALDRGDRVAVPGGPQDPQTATEGPQTVRGDLVPMSLVESMRDAFQGTVDALESERDYLRRQLDDAHEARHEAEARAAEAEARAAAAEARRRFRWPWQRDK